MKTSTIFWMFVLDLLLSSSSALGQHPSQGTKRGFSVVGIWSYKGGDEKPMEIRFLSHHKAMFKGGYEFYNPAQWYYFTPTTAELKLIVPRMKETDFRLFNQWKYADLRVNPKEKTIVYTLHQRRICFMGYFFEKE